MEFVPLVKMDLCAIPGMVFFVLGKLLSGKGTRAMDQDEHGEEQKFVEQ